MFIILTNPNKVLCIKIKQSSENSRERVCQGQAQYLQLINNKFGSNIDGHMKEQSWKNGACSLINFEVIFKKPP